MFKTKPFFREMVWGNPLLNEIFGVKVSENPLGEVWVLSDVEPGRTPIVKNGYVSKLDSSLAGLDLERFPLLVKVISSAEWLSIQVHPDDELARELEGEPWGKTEGWYFLKGGEIALGRSRESVLKALETGNWNDALDVIDVYEGEFVFLPAGVVHTLGPGPVLIEIQQASDLTYRLYDWGRPRELHVEKAKIAVKDFERSGILRGRINEFRCEYFGFEVVDSGMINGFKIVVFLEDGSIGGSTFKPFDTVLVEMDESVELEGRAMVIELGEFWFDSR